MRIAGRLRIGAATVALPDGRQDVSRAIAESGRTPDWARSTTTATLPVAGAGQTAESLALAAAAAALDQAGVSAAELGMLTHSWIFDPSPVDCTIAPRLARLLGARSAIALSMRQMSNGGAIAIQVTAAQMLAEPGIAHSLVLTADVHGSDADWRWNPEAGAALGDGATAVLLTRDIGGLSVHAMVSSSVTEGERWWSERAPGAPVVAGPAVFALRKCVRAATRAVLADAGLEPEDPRLAVIMLPRLPAATIEAMFLGLLPPAELLDLSGDTGHLFSGDLAANLEHLRSERPLAPGEYALLINMGVGHTVTMVVVRGEPATVGEEPA
ncbi:hypothetical protein [Nocardia sp. alder85J]|uniref:hypothetical protein n=1 Tax=Nocardia sp. alder85J TaxID=2862949 RepID=UPI001CD3711C|nr:hypothetical protein [Nocardia sp. alder85J]MCX4093116.1 hypothetical protein [Nocardia sp. alder85J]